MLPPPPRDLPPTDEDLLQAAYRYANSLTHNSQDAEDLVQEAWVCLWKKYGKVESHAVLFTAVRNLFVDQCRRGKLVQFDSLDHPTVSEMQSEFTEEAGVKGDLNGLLATLRASEREVLFLHYYQGHTAEEISGLLNQSRNTVLSLMHRAIAKLRVAEATSPLLQLSKKNLLLLLSLC
jgi:RNA polymerase sigma-70 factor (ECF subfamily)